MWRWIYMGPGHEETSEGYRSRKAAMAALRGRFGASLAPYHTDPFGQTDSIDRNAFYVGTFGVAWVEQAATKPA
jgi:hypothetical protein